MLLLFILWVVGSIAVGRFGQKRGFGYFPAMLISVFTSPVIGLIVVMVMTKDPAQEQYKQQMMQAQVAQAALLDNITKGNAPPAEATLSDELKRLQTLKEEGLLTEDEYGLAKAKVLAL